MKDLRASPTTSATSSTFAPSFETTSLPLVADAVVAADEGIFLVLHEEGNPIVQLWDQPTAVALMVGEDLVVAQRSTISEVYPRRTESLIVVFDPAGMTAWPMGEEQLTLLDAGVINLGVMTITIQAGMHIDGGFCFTAEWLEEAPACDQSNGGPVLIELSGFGHDLAGFDRGVPTVPRAGP